MFERILIVRLSALGDVVLATPALRALRARFPEARIDWLVERRYADVLLANRHLSSLVPYDKEGEHRGAAGLLRLRKQLGRQRYDLVIDLQHKPKTVALSRSLGARRVIALRKRTGPEAIRALLRRDRPLAGIHAVDLYLSPLAELGVSLQGRALEARPTDRARQLAATLGSEGAGRWVGIAPGARWATKRWDPARFAEVANQLAARGYRALLVGGPGDREALEAVRARLAAPPVGDTADLDVEGLLGAIARCRVLVAGDSGPMHLAAAVGTPVVALFGPTSPSRWAPVEVAHRVIYKDLVCSPCSNHGGRSCPIRTHACMKEIAPEEVTAAVLELISGASAAPREAQGG